MDYFISFGLIDTMHSYADNELLNQRVSFEELTTTVPDECREGEFKLSDFAIQSLMIHIASAIRRIMEGFKTNKLEEEELKLHELPERQITDSIPKRVSALTGIDFPVEEVDYTTLHLISKSRGNVRYISESMQEQMRQELIDSVEKINLEAKNNFQLIEGLLAHLSTMLICLEGKVVLENPLTTETQTNYQGMYQLAEQVITTMPTFQSFSLTPNEIAYAALHFMVAKERYRKQRKYNALTIYATGYGSAQTLKGRIENELGSLISIMGVIGYYEISDEKLKGTGFIVSSIDLSNLIFSIPVFTAPVFLADEELQKIKYGILYLNTSTSLKKMEDEASEPSVREVFDDYFSKEASFILSNISKDEVLRKLIKSISKHENDQLEKHIFDMTKQREAMSSIIFGEHIAVPYPMKAVGSKYHFAVALTRDELLWDDQYSLIKIVFLMLMSTHENGGSPELTSTIVDLVDELGLQEQILACQSSEEFRTLFFKIKER